MVESAMSKTMMEEVMASWSEGSEEEELVRELLDDGSPLLVLSQEAIQNPITKPSSTHFLSNIYSGPTISDIENALSLTNHRDHFPPLSSPRYIYKCFQTSLHYFLLLKVQFPEFTIHVSCFVFQNFNIGEGFEQD